MEKKVRINEAIRAKTVQLIDENGKSLGEIPISKALEMAEESSLDLVEVHSNNNIPVCKIIDYGKHKYNLKKKNQEAKKNQKNVKLKETHMTITIDVGDYNTLLNKTIGFLESGNKVKVVIKLRGREKDYKDRAFLLLNKFTNDIRKKLEIKVEGEPKAEGRNVISIIAAS